MLYSGWGVSFPALFLVSVDMISIADYPPGVGYFTFGDVLLYLLLICLISKKWGLRMELAIKVKSITKTWDPFWTLGGTWERYLSRNLLPALCFLYSCVNFTETRSIEDERRGKINGDLALLSYDHDFHLNTAFSLAITHSYIQMQR